MKETDYDSATPSLAQEMNLARRACWCNNSTKQQQQQKRYCANCCCHQKVAATTTATAANVYDDNEIILNGATFSKNILIVNKKDVNIEPSYFNATTTKTTETKTKPKPSTTTTTTNLSKSNLIKRHTTTKATTNAKPTVTTTTTIPNSIADNLSNNNNNAKNNKSDDDDVYDDHHNNEDGAENSDKPETTALLTEMPAISTTPTTTMATETHKNVNRSASGVRQQLLRFWLAFVAFCDAVTIKSNDPRFQNAHQSEDKNGNANGKGAGGTPTSSDSSSTSSPCATTTSGKKLGKFKLITSKKMIFLFLVCLFFNCLNRIEARPNMSQPSNAIASEDGLVSNVIDDGVAAARSAVGANPSDGLSSALPITLDKDKSLPTEHLNGVNARDDDGEEEDVDHEQGHAHDRYPLSQVDFERVKTPFIIGIWILSASIAKIGFHMTPKLHLIFPESCLLIVVGVIIGVVLFFCTEVAVSPLTPNTFFFYMLPPIILDAGYFMPNRLFFDNLGTILLMAVVGTIFNIASIGGSLYACGLSGMFGTPPKLLDTFLFASLISAVDPVAVLAVFEEIHVNEILYIVVFGESLLNDAVTVVMYHMMEVYNEIGISEIIAQDVASGVGSFFVVAIGGTVIGIIWGFLTGLVTRFTDHVRVIEPIFIFVMAYLAYLNAEIFHMSGILAITFCGITMKNYVESNISIKSHTTVKYALKMLSSSSETIIFMFLGVATVNNNHVWNTAFVLLTIIFCSVFRVIGVIILTAIANRFRLHKLSRVDQFVMSYGGLRGAVAFALVLLVDERVVKQKDMFVTTTIAVIYFTVFVQGITIKPLVKFLNVKRASKRKPTMNERIHERFMDHLMAGIEDIVGKTGNYNVRDKFKRFDNRFIRPLIIRDLKGAEPKIIETYSKLTMRDAMEVMRRNPSTIGQITGTESMSALFRNYTNNCIGGRWEPPTIYTTCPSLTNLDNNISRNLDMHELDYNPSKKDLTDAKIHHLLAEELKPYRRASIQMHRRLSYSRHAVDDRDLSTQVNYKMQMNFRRMFKDRQHHKRSKRGANKQQEGGVKQNHVSFHDFQQNGTTKQFTHDYINEVLNESAEEIPSKLTDVTVVGANDDWDDGLTFTAKSSPDSDRANNNSLIAHIQNLPGFDTSKARIVQHYAPAATTTATSSSSRASIQGGDWSPDQLLTPDIAPTAAELILPWRRDRSYQSFVAENPIPEEDRNMSRDSDGERRVATPTATESQLPWKRHEDEISDAVQQNEFPAWASNKEYLAYNSPSATFLGGINKPKHKSVIGLFRRESSGSKGSGIGGGIGSDVGDVCSARGSDPALAVALSSMVVPLASTPGSSRLDKRSQSIATPLVTGEGHSGQFPVTASHRRNVRRGSMLELSGDIIPEETYQHGQSKSLCEPSGDEWDSAAPLTGARPSSSNAKLGGGASGREPLLPKLTPRAQIRKMGSKNAVTTALLAVTANSDYDDDEDEDFELYDDENIVVTTTTTGNNRRSLGAAGGGGAASGASGSGGNGTTTTTIRLTRNNDESII